MVEADLVDDDARRLDLEQCREPPLKGDRDVAEPDRPVAGVEQGTRDDPHRVGEVDDPRVGPGELAHPLGDREHHGHGAHRLREAARAGRLLADAAARQRRGLVLQAGSLAADADLHEDEVGALDRLVEPVEQLQFAAEADAVEHPPREPPDDLEPGRVDVVEREPLELEPREARDQLRRIRRARADDGEPHPFTPVRVTPSTKARWARKKRMTTGAITTSVAAIVRFHCTWWRLRYCDSPTDTGQFAELSLV